MLAWWCWGRAFGWLWGQTVKRTGTGVAVERGYGQGAAAPREVGGDGTAWYELSDLGLLGTGPNPSPPYGRLPAHSEDFMPGSVWRASRRASGVYAPFSTDARTLRFRFRPAVDGGIEDRSEPRWVDLYARDGATFRPVRSARVESLVGALLFEGAPPGEHDYLHYLPLRALVESAQIGVPGGASLSSSPEWDETAPLCFAGGSLTEGARLHRPGNTFAAILGRQFNRPSVNLGFGGGGGLEEGVAAYMAEIWASAYVVECGDLFVDPAPMTSLYRFMSRLRAGHAVTPVILLEPPPPMEGWFVEDVGEAWARGTRELRDAYAAIRAGGDRHTHFVGLKTLDAESGGAAALVDPVSVHLELAEVLAAKLSSVGLDCGRRDPRKASVIG